MAIRMPPQRYMLSAILLLLFIIVSYQFRPEGPFEKVGAWYSILPPITAILLAYATRQLLWSLGLAVLVGGYLTIIQHDYSVMSSLGQGVVKGVGYGFSVVSDPWSLKILGFVIMILMMISIIIVAGGLTAIANRLQKYAQTRRSTKLVTAMMGLLVFIDDYANTMIVGSSMRPLSDKQKISREKLAFIVDATSAPVAGLAVVSTWIGYETGLFGKTAETLGINRDACAMFFDALPFRFYCILMLCFVFINLWSRRDFGPMLVAERRAQLENKILADNAVPMTSRSFTVNEADVSARIRMKTALIPFMTLFGTLLCGIWLDGGGLQKEDLAVINPFAWLEVISSTKNSSLILLLSSSAGLVVALLCARIIAKAELRLILLAAYSGLRSSVLPMLILILAWSLKSSCDDLNTGEYLVATIGQVLSPIWFPALLFMAAALTSFGTGTSWGTMAILIPTSIPVAYMLDGGQYGLITMISLGAVLDGSIFGDHCSPISDTTIMSSIASSCDHLHHVKTQVPYSLSVAGIALLAGYLPVASGMPAGLALLAGIILLLLISKLAGKTTVQSISNG